MKSITAIIALATVAAIADYPTIGIVPVPHVVITVPQEHIPYTIERCTNLTEGFWFLVGDPTNYSPRTVISLAFDGAQSDFYRITCWDGTMYMAPDTNAANTIISGPPPIPFM